MFASGFMAEAAAETLHINRNTANLWYRHLRELIHKESNSSVPYFRGEVEIDHTYFGGAQRRNGPEGTRAWSTNKIIVLGIFDRTLNGGTLYTQIVPNVKSSTLIPIIKRVVDKSATIHTDDWRGFKQLSKGGYLRFAVNHSAGVFFNRETYTHTGHVDAFWGRAKQRYLELNGIPRSTFHLFLKEREFHYNHRYVKDSRVRTEEIGVEKALKQILKRHQKSL